MIAKLVLFFALVISGCSDAQENTGLPTKKISLTNGKENIELTVEIANTYKQREIGLMFRKSLDMNKGMLFVFPVAKKHKFWMKNTYIPLDMIFFNNKNIVGLVENVQAHDLSPQGPDDLSNKVLEVPAGFINKHKVTKSWQLVTGI